MAAVPFSLKDCCCLVTGGTKGIGKAIVEEFCSLGAKVFTCGRTEEDLVKELNNWKSKGFSVQGCTADVAKEENCRELVKKVEAEFDGKLHVLVNNVGTNMRKTTLEYTSEDIDALISVNIKSAILLSQLCHPILKSTPSSSIVYVSSVAAGPRAVNSSFVYALTKAGINQMTKNFACEWASDDIRVNCVAPWYIETPLVEEKLNTPGFREKVCEETPMRRVGQPSDVSGVVAFFASKAASYVTGQTLYVDGGYSVKGFGY